MYSRQPRNCKLELSLCYLRKEKLIYARGSPPYAISAKRNLSLQVGVLLMLSQKRETYLCTLESSLCYLSREQGWAYILFKRTQRSCILLRSFQKNAAFSRSFAFFIKRTPRSLHSFMFFIKERCVLCVLLRSL